MSKERKRYQKELQKLLKLASIRELRGLCLFARAYLGKSD